MLHLIRGNFSRGNIWHHKKKEKRNQINPLVKIVIITEHHVNKEETGERENSSYSIYEEMREK